MKEFNLESPEYRTLEEDDVDALAEIIIDSKTDELGVELNDKEMHGLMKFVQGLIEPETEVKKTEDADILVWNGRASVDEWLLQEIEDEIRRVTDYQELEIEKRLSSKPESVLAYGRGYDVGDHTRIEFDGEEHEVVVFDKDGESLVLEVLWSESDNEKKSLVSKIFG